MPIADKEARARSFGAVADEYQRGRTGYTAATLRWRTTVRRSRDLLPR